MKLGEVLLLRTKGFFNEIEPELQVDIMERGLNGLNPETDFLVFDPGAVLERIEDEGRTVVYPSQAKDKVYVKLDDFGSAEELSENCGFTVNTKYAVTFMLAEEY